MPGSGYMVADRNRRDPDFTTGRYYASQAVVCHLTFAGDSAGHPGRTRVGAHRWKRGWQTEGSGGKAVPEISLAVDDPDYLQQSRTLPRFLFFAVQGLLFYRRRMQAR